MPNPVLLELFRKPKKRGAGRLPSTRAQNSWSQPGLKIVLLLTFRLIFTRTVLLLRLVSVPPTSQLLLSDHNCSYQCAAASPLACWPYPWLLVLSTPRFLGFIKKWSESCEGGCLPWRTEPALLPLDTLRPEAPLAMLAAGSWGGLPSLAVDASFPPGAPHPGPGAPYPVRPLSLAALSMGPLPSSCEFRRLASPTWAR